MLYGMFPYGHSVLCWGFDKLMIWAGNEVEVKRRRWGGEVLKI